MTLLRDVIQSGGKLRN